MMAKPERKWMIVALTVLSAVALGAAGALPVRSQSDSPAEPAGVDNIVGEAVGYQGHLTDSAGNPLSGTYTLGFELYRESSGGAPVFETGDVNVPVSDGLFDVALNVPQGVFDGGPLWMAIIVEGETLSPRQQIRPTPYAMSLRPGATVTQAATGTAVSVESVQGIGLHGAGQVYGLYGSNTGPAQGSGYGGYFETTTGVGVFGGSTAVPSTANPHVPGVYGYSERGAGVYGTSDGFFGYGVFGEIEGTGVGAYGRTATGYGVLGVSDGIGAFGVGAAQGVYGSNTAPASGAGYGGYFESTTGVGVFGGTTAVPSTTNALPAGVYGFSENGTGIYGEAGSNFAWAGYFDGHVRIDGSLVISDSLFANDKSGYVFDIAMNDDTEALSRGDVVVVTGVVPESVVGDIPVFTVRRASQAASTAVIGVADGRYGVDQDGRAHVDDGPVAPGEYVSVVTLGAFETVNVDATYGAILPGDLLISSPTPGHAMRADDPRTGTMIGKALGELEAGTGTIPVMVTLQ